MPPKIDDKERRRQQEAAKQALIKKQMADKQAAREEEQKEMAATAKKKQEEQERARQRLQQLAKATDQTIAGIVAHVVSDRNGGNTSANAGDGCAGGSASPISYYPSALPHMQYGGNLDTSFSAAAKFRIKDKPRADILVHAKPVANS